MVGSAMARDLASDDDFDVTVADIDPAALESLQADAITGVQADLSVPPNVTRLAAEYDLVLGALSSRYGLQTLEAVIEAGRDYVDISFMAEDGTTLSPLAQERGVTAVIDCGVAPGTSNMAAGVAVATLQPCERLEIYVGGLPVVRRWPFEYKAAFAPADVFEEYTRPSRIVEGGRVVQREALSEPELMDFPGVGTLEAFNTDGLRSLVQTLDVPDMIEKTLRYPGHIELMRVFRELGLFSQEPVEVDGQSVVPLSLTSKLLQSHWRYDEGEVDLTVLRIIAHGQLDGRRTRMQWDMLDHYDPATGERSMSRTTGYPATLMARAVASGRFRRPGVHPPEICGQVPGLFDEILEGLRARGIEYRFEQTSLDG